MSTCTTTAQQSDALVEAVREGDLVVCGALSATPRHLLSALARRADALRHLDLAAGMFLGDYSFLAQRGLMFRTWFPPGTVGGLSVDTDRIGYLPMSWSQVVDWLQRTGPDVLLLSLSPADEDGFHSFGTSASYTAPAVDSARMVLAEVNQRMPRTRGARIHHSRLDGFIEVDEPLPAFPSRPPRASDVRIAEHVAPLVEDGCTLQLGVGSLPDAVLSVLARQGRRDLHLLGNASAGLLRLHAAGCLADADRAVVVGEALGGQDLYDFIDDNPLVRMVGGDRTHSARALLEVPGLVSIGSALSVDAYGQVNTEYVDGHHVGAVGGAIDFTRAAAWPGNRSVIALRSTTAGGARSRIVPALDAATVSLPRDSTQFVVTEFGVADLRDKTVAERRRALAAVAHPDFRSSLEET